MRTRRADLDTLVVEDHPWVFVAIISLIGTLFLPAISIEQPGPDWLFPLWPVLLAFSLGGFTRVTLDRDEGRVVWTQRRLGLWERKRSAPIADIEEVFEGSLPLLRFKAESGRASWPLSSVRASLGLNTSAVANIRAFVHHSQAREVDSSMSA